MPSAEELKKLGNEHYAAGRDAEALEAYTQALNLPDARPLLHVLHSNSSAAHLRLGQAEAALEAALRCREAKPDWAKGFFREAQALAALHRPGHAEAAVRAGLERCGEDAALLIELEKVQRMRDLQGELGLQMNQPHMLSALPCDAFCHAFLGLTEQFKASFDPAKHIGLLAWKLRTPICSVIVSGAQRVEYVTDRPTGRGHAEILRFVCEAGARVDAKDAAGWTALGHATAHHAQLDLAKILLEHGADPNLPNRFGCMPLHNAVMGNSVAGVKLLLEAGARPHAPDVNGITPVQLSGFSREVSALFSLNTALERDRQRLQQVGLQPATTSAATGGTCVQCGEQGALRRCPTCALVLYCSAECEERQLGPVHAAQCVGPISPEGKAAAASSSSGSGSGGSSGQLRVKKKTLGDYSALPRSRQTLVGMGKGSGLGLQPGAAGRPDSTPFVLKVQVPLAGTVTDMMAYNQDRSFQTYLVTEGDGARLSKLIRSRGINGQKAYFLAWQDAGAGEVVVSETMLPQQPW